MPDCFVSILSIEYFIREMDRRQSEGSIWGHICSKESMVYYIKPIYIILYQLLPSHFGAHKVKRNRGLYLNNIIPIGGGGGLPKDNLR